MGNGCVPYLAVAGDVSACRESLKECKEYFSRTSNNEGKSVNSQG